MKRVMLITTILFALVVSAQKTYAQVSVGLNVNIGSQPAWGPTGYDHADYYYLPDIDVYYSVPRHEFVYSENGQWVFSKTLPARYRGYDLYSGYKVVINEPEPYLHADKYRDEYAKYKDRHDQMMIRDSHDPKYAHHYSDEYNGRNKHHRRRHHHDQQ